MPPTAQPAQNGGTTTQVPNDSSGSTTTVQTTKYSTTNGETRKITILKDAVQRSLTTFRSELGSSTDEFLNCCTTIDDFLDYVAAIRLRQIPHHSSRWDKVLNWAEFFAAQVSDYSEVTANFVAESARAASIIYASLRSLLELGRENVNMLEKAFGVFYGCALSLGYFIRQHEHIHHTEELQLILAQCYTDLLKLVTGISLYYSRKQVDAEYSSQAFEELFSANVLSFFSYSDRFTATIWATRLEHLSNPGDISFELMWEFLTPHDHVTRLLTTTRKVRRTRADFTCEWFDRPLAEFLRGGKEVLIVSGKPRTGKSYLSDWTVERLQTLTGRRATEVLSYTIDSDLKNELTSLSVVKGLLLQMLQLNVGDNALYKSLSHAYSLSKKGSQTAPVENALWTALQHGLTSSRNHTLVIDGVDQLKHGEADVSKLLGHLETVTAKANKTKVVLFSRSLSAGVTQKHAHFAITPEHTRLDIRYLTESLLASSPAFSVLSDQETSTVISKVTEPADGSFEWVVQVIALLKTETPSAAILKKLDTIPKTLPEVLALVISTVDLKQRDTKSLLAWLLVAYRPLLLSEIKQLFEIDTTQAVRNPRTTRIDDDVTKALGPLITIRDGFVRFSNPVFKEILLNRAASVTDFKNTGAFPFHLSEAHYDLTIRSMSYIKTSLTRPAHPTFSPLNAYELDEMSAQYDLLQYATRYWAWHFEASPMHEPVVKHKLTPGFKHVFPHNVMLSIVEGSTFDYQATIPDAIDHHLLTLAVRKLILGENCEAVLQTLLNLARLKDFTLQPGEINEYYYDAWKIAYSLKLTSIATICSQRYIERTSTITITSKSQTSDRRSELLEYIITIYRVTKESETEILRYLEVLVTLYVAIKEAEKVAKLRKEIYELHVKIYGRSAPQTLRSRDTLVTTVTTTPGSNNTDALREITESNYQDAARTRPISDPKRNELTWSMIDIYTKRNDSRRAEELLVWLWQGWSHHSHTNKDSKTQQQKIDVALRYAKFLKEHDRKGEAENILRGIATDLEETDTDDEEIIKRSRAVGDELTGLGSAAAARGLFSRLWAYYVKTGKTDSADAKGVSSSLDKATSGSITDTTLTETDTLRNVFESVSSKTDVKTFDARMVHTSITLINTYYVEQRWDQVITIALVTLTKLWSGWTSTEIRSSLPSNYIEETVTILHRLYKSYFRLRQHEKAENTLRRFFYAVISTPKSSDELLFSSSKDLIDFYETHGQLDKVVLVYRDLYTEIEKRKGNTDVLTISTLYKIGDLALRINDTKTAEFAYRTIYTNLGTEPCHRDGLRAAQALITIYEQQRQYAEARKVYQSIWAMFIKHGKDYDLKPEWSADFYEKYDRNIKQDPKYTYENVRQLAADNRKALVRFYGPGDESTVKATILLAEINEEKPEHDAEAIAMIEEADKQVRGAPKGHISEPTITIVSRHHKRLPYLYSKSSQLSTSPKAIPLYEQEWQTHNKHGHSHGDALKWLLLLVLAYAKQNDAGLKTKGINATQSSVVDVVKNEKDAQRLWTSGAKLANVYLKAGLKPEGEVLLQHLRSQVIFGDSPISQALGFTPTNPIDRRTWVFLVSYQTTLHGNPKSQYTTVMADLINEVFLYESYRRLLTTKGPFLDTLVYASRLLQFMRDINDEPSHARVEKEFLQYFATSLSAPSTINPIVLREFFEIVLLEVHYQDMDYVVLKTGTATTINYYDKGSYAEAHDLAFLVDRFQQFVGGYGSIEKFNYGLQLALAVAGHKKTKVPDAKFRTTMLALASKITQQLVQQSRSNHIALVDIPINDLSTLGGLLGETGNLVDLDYILSILWKARTTQSSWPASTIVCLGRRLVETEYARGHHATAIHLCEDMCYNLRRVWGALDATTLDMHVLLSEFFTSSEQYRKAMQVHEDVLRDTVSEKGAELDQAQAAAIAVQHLELLKRAYQRNGKWDKEPQVYVDLYQQLAHIFGSEANWKKANVQALGKWSNKGVDGMGIWTKPTSFEWVIEEGQRKHSNHLRKSLGFAGLTVHGGRLARS